jgi:hypothetical protein
MKATKIYTHQDRKIDTEFLNLYNNIGLGNPLNDVKVGNLNAVYVYVVLSANTQTKIKHQLNRKPVGAIPVVSLSDTLVPFTITQMDENYITLTSNQTGRFYIILF